MDLYLFRQEQQTGPYTEADARALVAAAEIEHTCLAWQEAMPEWILLNPVLDLSARPSRSPSLVGLPQCSPVPVRCQAIGGADQADEAGHPDQRLWTSGGGEDRVDVIRRCNERVVAHYMHLWKANG